MTRLLAAVLALVLVPGAACSSASEAEPEGSAPSVTASSTTAEESPSASSAPSQTSEGAAQAAPRLKVTKIATGLDHPWDVHPIGQGRFLVTERVGRLAIIEDGKVRRLQMPTDLIWASGETGLMGLAIDPDFAGNGRFYTCSGGNPQGTPDVRIMVWKLNAAATRASYQRTLLSGFPATSGRHGGCRLLILDDGALLVGTGDAATGTNPEDKTSLGGKTLMLDRISGDPWPDNPFVNAANKRQRYVHTYGHRNVQGLAQRADGTLWSAEHGPDRDDEVNLLKNGGDYGWNPVPGYNESVPMTDQWPPGQAGRGRLELRVADRRHVGRLVRRGQGVGLVRRHARRRRAEGQRGAVHEVRLRRQARRRPDPGRADELRPPPRRHRPAQRQPAHHDRQRRRRRGAAGATRRLRCSRAP